jgi:hypothetical protein
MGYGAPQHRPPASYSSTSVVGVLETYVVTPSSK